MRSEADYKRLTLRAEAEKLAERSRVDCEVARTKARMAGVVPATVSPIVSGGKYAAWKWGGTVYLDVGEIPYRLIMDEWKSLVVAGGAPVLTGKCDCVKLPDCRALAGAELQAVIESFEAWQAKQGG